MKTPEDLQGLLRMPGDHIALISFFSVSYLDLSHAHFPTMSIITPKHNHKLFTSQWPVVTSYLSHKARSWLRPTLTNISLALNSSCRMMSVRRQASTSGLVSLRDRERQWLMSWWPQAVWSLCRDKIATQRYALGALGFQQKAMISLTVFTGLILQ